METLTHYKRLANPDYLGAYSLYSNEGVATDLVVSIKSIARKEVIGTDGKKDMCMVADIHGNKPLILNATNQKMLKKLVNSPFIEHWINKPFTLYVATIKVAGEPTECLRIRPELPKTGKQELKPGHEKWDGAMQAMKDGNTTIMAIEKTYFLSEPNKQALINAAHSAL